MSDVLALPTYALGIPIPDCNVNKPNATYGVAAPPWGMGSTLVDQITGLHPDPTFSSSLGCNRDGSGRSILVSFAADMDGGTDSVLNTPATYWGYVPKMGTSYAWYPQVWVIAHVTLQTGQSVEFELFQYNAAGSVIGSGEVIGTLTDADTFDGWRSFVLTSSTERTISPLCRFFRVFMNFDSDGSVLGSFGLDFIGLGWVPGIDASQGPAEGYSPDGYDHGPVSSVEMVGHGIPGAMQSFPMGLRGGAALEEHFAIEYIRASQSTRDLMEFYWRAGRGSPSANDRVLTGSAGVLMGKFWPTLIRPSRPGVKQAFYALPLDPKFPFVVDNRARYVEATSYFSGAMNWREQSY